MKILVFGQRGESYVLTSWSCHFTVAAYSKMNSFCEVGGLSGVWIFSIEIAPVLDKNQIVEG